MSRKRKSEATGLDEADRTLHSTFCGAANSLSQLYTQSMNQQKISFQAGERHSLEKLYEWILRQHEEGSRVTTADIVSHIQNEIDYPGEDASMSPLQFQHQHPQTAASFISSGVQTSSSLREQPSVAFAPQMKNSVFSNAPSSPIRWNLQPYQLGQGGGGCYPNSAHGVRNHDANSHGHKREFNSPGFNDSSMDMHPDSPTHESY